MKLEACLKSQKIKPFFWNKNDEESITEMPWEISLPFWEDFSLQTSSEHRTAVTSREADGELETKTVQQAM